MTLARRMTVAPLGSDPGAVPNRLLVAVVLLSPACASFDMFRDFAERGEAFAQAVERIL